LRASLRQARRHKRGFRQLVSTANSTIWVLPLILRRLYSEKAYVLSRGFVKQALTSPPEGLQDEIRHYYYTTGHLKDVVDHAKALMEKEADVPNGSEGSARWDSDVIGSLTAGAKLSLKVRRVFIPMSKADYRSESSRVWRSRGKNTRPLWPNQLCPFNEYHSCSFIAMHSNEPMIQPRPRHLISEPSFQTNPITGPSYRKSEARGTC